MMQALSERFGRWLAALALLGCLLLLAMMLIIVADVALRNIAIPGGPQGLSWSNEVSELMLYLITMCVAPWLLRQGQHIRVDIFLQAKADLNLQDSYGWTALIWATLFGFEDCTGALIKAKADVNIVDFYGTNALMVAVSRQHLDSAKMLIDANTNIYAVDDTGSNALFYADDLDMVRLLLKAGIDVNAEELLGWTALMIAALFVRDLDIVTALINAKADINHQNNEGFSVLMSAVAGNNVLVVRALLTSELDVNAKDNYGFRALNYAREREIFDMLVLTSLESQDH